MYNYIVRLCVHLRAALRRVLFVCVIYIYMHIHIHMSEQAFALQLREQQMNKRNAWRKVNQIYAARFAIVNTSGIALHMTVSMCVSSHHYRL